MSGGAELLPGPSWCLGTAGTCPAVLFQLPRTLPNAPSLFLQPLPTGRWMAWRTGKEGSARRAP